MSVPGEISSVEEGENSARQLTTLQLAMIAIGGGTEPALFLGSALAVLRGRAGRDSHST